MYYYLLRLLLCRLIAKAPLCKIAPTHNHRRLWIQWSCEHSDWCESETVVFLTNPPFNSRHHDDHIHFRCYACERNLPGYIECHTKQTPEVKIWGAIAYHGVLTCYELGIILTSTGTSAWAPDGVPKFPKHFWSCLSTRQYGITCCKECSRLLLSRTNTVSLSSTYSPDMSPFEHEWDFICRRLIHNPHSTALTDEFWARIQTIWNVLPQADI